MDRDTLITILILVSIIGVFFSGIIIFLLMTMFRKQVETLEAAAQKVQEVKDTLASSSKISNKKMDSLAKEETLQQVITAEKLS